MIQTNVTADVKHCEDCEQLFFGVGKCLVTEALLEFFRMVDTNEKPTQNLPNFAYIITDEQKASYVTNTLDKYLDQYVFVTGKDGQQSTPFGSDGLCCYLVNMLKSFIHLADYKDAIATSVHCA